MRCNRLCHSLYAYFMSSVTQAIYNFVVAVSFIFGNYILTSEFVLGTKFHIYAYQTNKVVVFVHTCVYLWKFVIVGLKYSELIGMNGSNKHLSLIICDFITFA